MIKLIIPGEPIPQARPRLFGKRAYNPQAKEKQAIKWIIYAALKKELTNESIYVRWYQSFGRESYSIDLTFYTCPAQNLTQQERSLKLWNIIPNTTKPDLDNYIKFILDCGNGILWHDDNQITHINARKLYSQNPRTEIIILTENKFNITDQQQKVLKEFTPHDIKVLIDDLDILYGALSCYQDNVQNNDGKENASIISAHIIKFAEDYGARLHKISKRKDKNNAKP